MTNWVMGWRVLAERGGGRRGRNKRRAEEQGQGRKKRDEVVSNHSKREDRETQRRTEGVESLLDVSGKLGALDELVLELNGLLSGRDLAGEEVPEHALGEHLLATGGGGENLLALGDPARRKRGRREGQKRVRRVEWIKGEKERTSDPRSGYPPPSRARKAPKACT